MQDWNVVITIRDRGFKRAFSVFREFGPISETGFFNVLALRAHDTRRLMESLQERLLENPEFLAGVARVIPVSRVFTFHTPEDFDVKAQESVLAVAQQVAGKRFYIRMHRRGFKGQISSMEEERFLSAMLLEHLGQSGEPGKVDYTDPDAVIVIETLGQWAGLSVWTREELLRYPFLGLGAPHAEAEELMPVRQSGTSEPCRDCPGDLSS